MVGHVGGVETKLPSPSLSFVCRGLHTKITISTLTYVDRRRKMVGSMHTIRDLVQRYIHSDDSGVFGGLNKDNVKSDSQHKSSIYRTHTYDSYQTGRSSGGGTPSSLPRSAHVSRRVLDWCVARIVTYTAPLCIISLPFYSSTRNTCTHSFGLSRVNFLFFEHQPY